MDKRLKEYYKTKKYRGFYKVGEHRHRWTGTTHLTFSDGSKQVHAVGLFREGALEKAFNKIDKFHNTQNGDKSTLKGDKNFILA
ncbi:hypothetical protein [Fodinibius sediminis]|uniref:Uncharacterized protein n=1 Tax=Fodinibius sediminis TaxID=1214077 RepID=A0A521AVP7_9BACT|nr:hypothetical protein [Fodinibius sediminis]SMO38922.1 hypothetical protein SAMN06265218_101420 [Fodinibius sediminis]